MQILSDYWVVDLRMTFMMMMMMIYVTYSVGKSTANSCSLVAFSAKTTHWTSPSHSTLMVLHLSSHPTNKIFGPFSWSSMNFLQDWGNNSVLLLSKLSVWILVILGLITFEVDAFFLMAYHVVGLGTIIILNNCIHHYHTESIFFILAICETLK